jgi:magnesium chelatase subunit H
MQYWLGGSDDNVEQMVRFLISRYASADPEWRKAEALGAGRVPRTGLYHPACPDRITTDPALPGRRNAGGTVGLLMMRSYVLASDTAHYDAVIRALRGAALRVIPAFAGGLDGRPAIDAFFKANGTPKHRRAGFADRVQPCRRAGLQRQRAAVEVLQGLDLPYIAAHPLEFQTLQQWAQSSGGLGPVETTMLIALPEIDGATNPTVFGGRHGDGGCTGLQATPARASTPGHGALPRTDRHLADKVLRLARLNRRKRERRAQGRHRAVRLPAQCRRGGHGGLSVGLRSLFNTLHADEGRRLRRRPARTVEALRDAVLKATPAQYGQEANVAAHVPPTRSCAGTPWLNEIEAVWGPAPGRIQSDGRGVFVLGAQFGNVFVGVQPAFGYEGDPMRLLFEQGFAPTHAFAPSICGCEHAGADALLHFGMHGALEFMPGKQAGLGARATGRTG